MPRDKHYLLVQLWLQIVNQCQVYNLVRLVEIGVRFKNKGEPTGRVPSSTENCLNELCTSFCVLFCVIFDKLPTYVKYTRLIYSRNERAFHCPCQSLTVEDFAVFLDLRNVYFWLDIEWIKLNSDWHF